MKCEGQWWTMKVFKHHFMSRTAVQKRMLYPKHTHVCMIYKNHDYLTCWCSSEFTFWHGDVRTRGPQYTCRTAELQSTNHVYNGNTFRDMEYVHTYIYMQYMIPSSAHEVPPPNGMGPQVAPRSLLFARYWQHFWGPASYLLGSCSDSDYQPRIY